MVAQVDTEEIGRMTAPRESALLGFLLSSHVIKLITSYLEDRDPLKRRLESIEMNWHQLHFRMIVISSNKKLFTIQIAKICSISAQIIC